MKIALTIVFLLIACINAAILLTLSQTFLEALTSAMIIGVNIGLVAYLLLTKAFKP